jgi:hypothetical protein
MPLDVHTQKYIRVDSGGNLSRSSVVTNRWVVSLRGRMEESINNQSHIKQHNNLE